jgi:hypothetical protein
MVIITYIYAPNERTKQTIDSFQRFGYEVAIVRDDSHRGNGGVLRQLYECYQRASGGHETFVYADAADSYCQRKFEELKDYILYSTEKACYPRTEIATHYKPVPSPWKYLNGGGYGGPVKLILEFFERYGLTKHPGDCNGQHEQMMAYLQAEKEGFPIKLDTQCEIFQTMAFADPCEFEIVTTFGGFREHLLDESSPPKYLKNKITDTVPGILHFNGLTDMSILKQLK